MGTNGFRMEFSGTTGEERQPVNHAITEDTGYIGHEFQNCKVFVRVNPPRVLTAFEMWTFVCDADGNGRRSRLRMQSSGGGSVKPRDRCSMRAMSSFVGLVRIQRSGRSQVARAGSLRPVVGRPKAWIVGHRQPATSCDTRRLTVLVLPYNGYSMITCRLEAREGKKVSDQGD